jgi:septal ring factor EnvC (AmiA/AmiB activator)
MKLFQTIVFLLLVTATAGTARADERVDHFEGEPAETLEQAVANFSDYNARLSEVLSQDKLTASDLARVHELSYTLENALGKINSELKTLSETLESLHLASEALDDQAARDHGREYLETAAKVIE